MSHLTNISLIVSTNLPLNMKPPWSLLHSAWSLGWLSPLLAWIKVTYLRWGRLSFSASAQNAPYTICQQIWKTQQWPQDWKRSVFILIPKKGNVKECSNYGTITLISHANQVMLKILQARLQQYVNRELPDVQAAFRKGRGMKDQIVNICWIIEKQESSRKTSISALLTMSNPLTVWTTRNCGKFWKRWEYQTTWPASWEICRQVKK